MKFPSLSIVVIDKQQIDAQRRRTLEHRRAIAAAEVRVLRNALDSRNGLGVPGMHRDSIVTQRMYLSMMETKLARLEAELAAVS
jgi:hypothetical protein